MKRIPKKELLLALVGVVFLALTAPGPALTATPPKPSEKDPKVFEIRERMFIQQCNDIYLNPEEYLGRTVKLEGIYEEYLDEAENETFCYVIRYGPGCCGNDGVAGFQVLFHEGYGDNDKNPPPKPNDWVEAVGTVELDRGDEQGNQDDQDEEPSVVLRLSRLTVMQKRGKEFVEN
ncbi:MAG: hypothetical protein LBO68_01590 [Synergistaceae bacterium]|nr:hypothetical protein [Synergistaceae bacterium]